MKKLTKKTIIIIAVIAVLAVGGLTALAIGLSAGRKPLVTEAEARSAAFAHAGVTEDQVVALQITKDRDDGREVYDIEFRSAERVYSYEVAVRGGEILKSSYDQAGGGLAQGGAADGSAAQTEAAQTEAAQTEAPQTEAPQTEPAAVQEKPSGGSQTEGSITEEQARSIALSDAGVSESDAKYLLIWQDKEDGRMVYEVEFCVDGTEYDYVIDYGNGKILEKDFDRESHYGGHGAGNGYGNGAAGDVISLDEAAALALSRVEGAGNNNIKIELDWDDGRPIYEGEIRYGALEYEFEMDAYTGDFIEWSMD